jgi:beta-glucanase (GH16 family)
VLNKTFFQSGGAIFSLLLLTAPLLAGNVLTNPGFESDPAGSATNLPGWTAYGGNAYSETSPTLAHSGTNYFKVYQAFNGQVNDTGIYQDYISGPGTVYSANGWAFTLTADQLAGQNAAWIEVTFRDAAATVLALYRSALITTNAIAAKTFPTSTWINLPVTNQYNPSTFVVTNTTTALVAPAGTLFVRLQIVFQGDAHNSGGSVYFDDLNLTQVAGAPYGGLNIVWDDEFNGPAINTNLWTYDLGNGGSNPGWGNNELEYYTSRTNNAYVANGFLHLAARQESTNGFSYTSARLKSQGLFSWKYGRFEWRAQMPAGVGCWPALWLLGTNITSISWPGCGEIDVMENNGANPLAVQGSLHSGSDETAVYNFINGDSATSFHTYTLDWTTNALLFYVDGHLYENQAGWGSSTTNAYPFPFNQPFFLLMNLAVGGNYLGNPGANAINASAVFPREMLLDYVRIYAATAPLLLSVKHTGASVVLSWPTNIVCHLEVQTNLLTSGLGTNWVSLAPTNSPWSIAPGTGCAYYRLLSP